MSKPDWAEDRAIAGLVEQLFALSRAEHDDLSIGGQAATTLEALAARIAELEEWNRKQAADIIVLGQQVGELEAALAARIAEAEARGRQSILDVLNAARQRESRLWEALLWIDTFDPESTAAVEARYALDLRLRQVLPLAALIGED